ncbi:MAG: hypothetical protein WAW61_13925, partial [Methylococcaceae bacterium]
MTTVYQALIIIQRGKTTQHLVESILSGTIRLSAYIITQHNGIFGLLARNYNRQVKLNTLV